MNLSTHAAQNEEMKAFTDMARSFARKELSQHVIDHEYPYGRDMAEVFGTAREAGLFGINLPLEWGGTGLDAIALADILREMSSVDAGMAAVLFTHSAALETAARAAGPGTDSCRPVYELAASPEGVPLAFQSCSSPEENGIPEVSGKSRPLLNGRLAFLVLGDMARHAIAPGARKGQDGFSWYLVDLSAQGVMKSGPILTLGFQACRAVDVGLKDVPGLLIGTEGQGGASFRRMQCDMSLPAAALSLGIMEGSFREALSYANQRWQGSRNIVEWPGVRMKLAEIAIQIEVARSCLSGIVAARDTGSPGGNNSALAAAIHISELACCATSEGVQVLGGNGYMKDYGQEKRMRDARQARSLLGMVGLKKMSYIDRVIEEANV